MLGGLKTNEDEEGEIKVHPAPIEEVGELSKNIKIKNEEARRISFSMPPLFKKSGGLPQTDALPSNAHLLGTKRESGSVEDQTNRPFEH